jgi:hypothetical protein
VVALALQWICSHLATLRIPDPVFTVRIEGEQICVETRRRLAVLCPWYWMPAGSQARRAEQKSSSSLHNHNHAQQMAVQSTKEVAEAPALWFQ